MGCHMSYQQLIEVTLVNKNTRVYSTMSSGQSRRKHLMILSREICKTVLLLYFNQSIITSAQSDTYVKPGL